MLYYNNIKVVQPGRNRDFLNPPTYGNYGANELGCIIRVHLHHNSHTFGLLSSSYFGLDVSIWHASPWSVGSGPFGLS